MAVMQYFLWGRRTGQNVHAKLDYGPVRQSTKSVEEKFEN